MAPHIPEDVRRSNPVLDRKLAEFQQQAAQRAMQTGMGTPQGPVSPGPAFSLMDAPRESVSQPRILAPAAKPPTPLVHPPPKPANPPTPAETDASKEFTRLTIGPQARSGIEKIGRNPEHPGGFGKKLGRTLLQVADAIGTGLFPNIAMAIPGTQLHHQALVGQAQNALDEERENRYKTQQQELQAAQTAESQARTSIGIPAQAEHDLASAFDLMNPDDKNQAHNTVTTDQGIMQYDPATKRYSIKVGNAPGKSAALKVESDEEGNVYVIDPETREAKPVTINGKPMKGKPTGAGASARPLTAEQAAALNQTWNAIAKKYHLPENQFSEGMSNQDATAIRSSLNEVISRSQGGQNIIIRQEGLNQTNAQREITNAATLRDDLMKDPAFKNFAQISQSYGQIQNARSGKPVSDIGLMYAYMKMLDPNSIILPTEYANAQNAGGLPAQVVNTWNYLIGGGKLTPEMRTQFLNQGELIYQQSKRDYTRVQDQYRGMAERQGIDPRNVIMDRASTAEPATTGNIPTVTTKAEFDALPSGTIYMENGHRMKKP